MYKQMAIASGNDINSNVSWRHSPRHFPEGNLVYHTNGLKVSCVKSVFSITDRSWVRLSCTQKVRKVLLLKEYCGYKNKKSFFFSSKFYMYK